MMLRRLNFYSVCLLISLSILLIIAGSRYTINTNHNYNNPSTEKRSDLWNIRRMINEEDMMQKPKNILSSSNGSPNVEKLLEIVRNRIKVDLQNYNFSHSGVEKMEDLLMESGGTPVRSLIVSSWRHGSTFLGQVLNAMPGNFYHYEPLLKYRIIQISGPPLGDIAIRDMKSMFKCDYSDMESYFNYGKINLQQFSHNTRLWELCKYNTKICYDPNTTASICKLYPFQSMKVVRLSLQLVEEILQDKTLNVRVVLLIRDPRGVMQSRRHRNFCRPAPDCSKPERLCAEMIRSYMAASRMLHHYPDRFMVVRFEELALNPYETTLRLLKFLRLGATDSVHEFLKTHTNYEIAGVNSTYRVSRDVVFKWMNTLDFESVQKIQEPCKEAMDLWGYRLVHNASHMASKNYYPMVPYSL